jgi:hypothetical protein
MSNLDFFLSVSILSNFWLSNLCISFFWFLQDGLRITYFWIKEQIEKEEAQGIDLSVYGSSKVVGTQAPVELGSLRAADGKEWSWLSSPKILPSPIIIATIFVSMEHMGMLIWIPSYICTLFE